MTRTSNTKVHQRMLPHHCSHLQIRGDLALRLFGGRLRSPMAVLIGIKLVIPCCLQDSGSFDALCHKDVKSSDGDIEPACRKVLLARLRSATKVS